MSANRMNVRGTLSGPIQILGDLYVDGAIQSVGDGPGDVAQLDSANIFALVQTGPFQDKGGQVFNVKAYGAVGDAVTDDTAAIQAAIAAASAAGGGTVLLPIGTVLVSATLTLASNVTLQGVSCWKSTIKLKAATLLTRIIHCTAITNWAIRDLGVDGTGATNTFAGEGCRAIEATAVAGADSFGLIENCFTKDTSGSGIKIYGTSAIRVVGNICTNAGLNSGALQTSAGIEIGANNATTTDILIAQNLCYGNGAAGIAVRAGGTGATNRVGILGNQCRSNGQSGASLSDIELQSAAPCTDIIIANNTVLAGASGNGIFLKGNAGSARVLCADNIIRHSGGLGIAVQDVGGNTIAQYVIRGNIITPSSNAFEAISISNNTPCLIENNDVSGSGASPKISIGATNTGVVFRNNKGYNPIGALTPPAVPASTVAYTNVLRFDCTVYVTGGTVTDIKVGGTSTGMTSGTFRVPAGQTITLTYSVAPTWTWFGD
jgi:hypothetical protein